MGRWHEQDDADDEDFGPSKTQVKREMTELQELGARLLDLPDSQLAALGLEERLLGALREHRRLPTFEARRRQMQFIGKLLRDADSERLQAAVERHRRTAAKSVEQAERWRDRLIDDETALTEWAERYPAAHDQGFRTLLRNARRERHQQLADLAAGKPVAKSAAKHYRELYRLVRAALVAEGNAPSAQSATDEDSDERAN